MNQKQQEDNDAKAYWNWHETVAHQKHPNSHAAWNAALAYLRAEIRLNKEKKNG